MSLCGCNFKGNCAIAAMIISVFVGVVTTFLQITAVITVTPAFLWVAFGIAVVFLKVLVFTSAASGNSGSCCSRCSVLNTLLAGILGTILLALILLAVGITATSLLSAILIGILLFFITLIFTSAACYIKCLSACDQP